MLARLRHALPGILHGVARRGHRNSPVGERSDTTGRKRSPIIHPEGMAETPPTREANTSRERGLLASLRDALHFALIRDRWCSLL